MIIVGAGPAGLAAAAVLRRQGHQPTVLEQAREVGASWRGRWDSLHLHTMRAFSGLPDAPIPWKYGRWVSRDDYVRYLRDYADHFEIRPEFGVRVERIDADADTGGWLVHSTVAESAADSTGTTRFTDAVVIATGYSRVAHIPDWPGRSVFRRPIVHSVDYRNPRPYAGRRVLVVGAGNSAADIATELLEVGATVQMSVRTPPNIVRRSALGVPTQLVGLAMKQLPEPVLNPLSGLLRRVSVPDLAGHGLPAPKQGYSQYLRTRRIPILDHGFVDEVTAGRIAIVAAVDSLTKDTVRLVDGAELSPDVVICGTGFSPGLTSMAGHLGVLDDRGRPLVSGGDTLPTAPRLHFVGVIVELSGVLHRIGSEARSVGQALRTSEPVLTGPPATRRG